MLGFLINISNTNTFPIDPVAISKLKRKISLDYNYLFLFYTTTLIQQLKRFLYKKALLWPAVMSSILDL